MDLDLPPPELVQDARGLERLLDDLSGQNEIAVDTEADSFFNFREKVCLVQITVEDRDYLVDPLRKLDLSGLGRVLADPAKTKVFHDGEYDVLILKRDYGFDFGGLFDTRVAAAALGVPNPGLASVLRNRFGIDLDKSMQRSNWSARPLSPKQISYARLDTHFLIPLMHEQRPELERRGRAMIVEGECRRLESLVPGEIVFEPDDFVKIKGARKLEGEGLRALRELFVLRHEIAERVDMPPFKVLNNQALLALAEERPRDPRALEQVPGFSARQARRLGDRVLAALERAREAGPLRKVPVPAKRDGTGALSEEEFELHERLKQWRKERAVSEGFDSSLVINRHVLLRLATDQPRAADQLARVDGLLDWQVEMFGDELVDLIDSSLRDFARNGLPRRRRSTRRAN